MNDEIQILIDALKRGQYEDRAEKIALLAAALRENQVEVPFLINLLRAPQVALCLAALEAIKERQEPEFESELIVLAKHSDFQVRLKVAETLRADIGPESFAAFRTLIKDEDSDVREIALKGTSGLIAFLDLQKDALANDEYADVRMAAVQALGALHSPVVVDVLFQALAKDAYKEICFRCSEVIESFLRDSRDETLVHLPTEINLLWKAEIYLKEKGAERFPLLFQWISEKTAVAVDPVLLTRFGTDLTEDAHKGSLARSFLVDDICNNLLTLIHRNPGRSIALVGAAGIGKTSIVNELVHRLSGEREPWHVLRVSPTEFLAGTKWLGEWQTKLNDLIQIIRKPRRILLYVPNLNELTATGTTNSSESNVATALAPYLEDGSVVLLGECTSEEFEEGVSKNSSFARLLDKVLVQEPSLEKSREVVRAVRDDLRSHLTDKLLDQLVELSDQYLSHIRRPGNAVGLLRELVKAESESSKPLNFHDVLQTLSRSTGVPVSLLDDTVALQEPAVREFFEKKIVGQKEALDAVVDLVLLIKAGLTDPQKPSGILLFVGPTGVGKTELARSLAAFIFGDPGRLKRFDMSEYADAYGFQRLIGGRRENGKLTDAVREQPFSVILFDEIEKSHQNVFDLCLQLFDAGRLTDGNGRTVDFRRTIIILTSNIGATSHTSPLGFGSSATQSASEIDKERTFRELSRFFRPEFLNRIDRIVQFHPLSLQVAEQIARREIDLVLQRSGIQRRGLVIDVDPTVVSLLVQEGYSPHFGARPLKRVVEQLLLQPLSRTIAGGLLQEKSILRMTERNGKVEVLRPTIPENQQSRPSSLLTLMEQCRSLREIYDRLEPVVLPLAERKSELLESTHRVEFFYDPELRNTSLGEIHNLEQFLSFHERVGQSLSDIEKRLEHPTQNDAEEASLRERLKTLGNEIRHLRFVSQTQDSKDLGDVLVSMTLVDRDGKDLRSIEKLIGMYEALAARRRMGLEILGEFYDDKQDRAYLLVSGLGAYGLMRTEAGLHQIGRRYKENLTRSGREVLHEDREIVRVELYESGTQPPDQFIKRTRSTVSSLKSTKKRLLNATVSVVLFHEPSVRSLEFWSAGPQGAALQRGLAILHAQVETGGGEEGIGIVRQYDIGLAPKVKDHRTGRSSERVEKIFKGELGSLLGYDEE